MCQTKRRGKNMSMSLRRKTTGRRRKSISKNMTTVITRKTTRKKKRCQRKTPAHRTPAAMASVCQMVAGTVADAQKARRRRMAGVSKSQIPATPTLPLAHKCARPPREHHSALADQAFSFSLVRVVFAGTSMSAACDQQSASKIVQTLLVASDVYVGKDSRRTQRTQPHALPPPARPLPHLRAALCPAADNPRSGRFAGCGAVQAGLGMGRLGGVACHQDSGRREGAGVGKCNALQ